MKAVEVLRVGDVVVARHEEFSTFIVWNGSLTFSWYVVDESGDWTETDVFSVSEPPSYEEAVALARERMEEEVLDAWASGR